MNKSKYTFNDEQRSKPLQNIAIAQDLNLEALIKAIRIVIVVYVSL